MKTFLGIDLGSTTTKAVVLSPNGAVVGRGLTNTRANFETASAIARSEALADTRLTILRQGLGGQPETRGIADRFVDRVQAEYQRAQVRYRLERLQKRCLAMAPEARVAAALEKLFEALDLEVGATGMRPDIAFREQVLASAATAAEAAADDVPYEAVVGTFERALVADEAEPGGVEIERVLSDVEVQKTGLGDGASELRELLARAVERAIEEPIDLVGMAGTGYGRHRLPFEKEQIRSEILCHGMGAHHTFPGTRTLLDIGGQDTKAIQLDETGLVTSFQMNDRCAAGCGRYLGYVADELGMTVGSLAPLAAGSSCPSKINSTCTVFAGAEIRERLALGEKREDVVAGLHRAIVLRAMSLLARSGGVKNQLTFSGGVARNDAVVKFLRDAVAEHYGPLEVNVSLDSIFYGAMGAALFARMDPEQRPC